MQIPELDYDPTIPTFMRRLVEAHPDLELIVTPDSRMTYGQADEWSRELAKVLLARGVGKGTHVAYMFGNGVEWLVSFLAIGRIGALAMPFSTLYRPAELRTTLLLGDVDTLIIPADLMGKDHVAFVEEAVPSLAGVTSNGPLHVRDAPYLRSVLVVGPTDRAWATPLEIPSSSPADGPIDDDFLDAVEAEVHRADPLMVIFTSGATAQPKAVVHTHAGLIRHSHNVAESTDSPWDQRLLTAMPFFWIGGISTTIFVAMQRRSTLLCTAKFDPEASLELLATEEPTGIMMMPGLMNRLRSYADEVGRPISVPPSTAPAADGRHGQQLGMTETIAAYIVNGGWDRPIPPDHTDAHGYKVPCMQYRIADLETGETLGEGVEGEICVRGYSLTIGMLKRERHDTFDDDGWYHTGDKGLLRGDFITFTGRAKDLIKTAGANVAPREVEVLLDADPGVLMSLVVGVPDEEREEIVGVVIIPAAGATVDVAALVRSVAKDLSSYKVPRRALVLPETELPYLATGKPDRARVRDLLIARGTDLA